MLLLPLAAIPLNTRRFQIRLLSQTSSVVLSTKLTNDAGASRAIIRARSGSTQSRIKRKNRG